MRSALITPFFIGKDLMSFFSDIVDEFGRLAGRLFGGSAERSVNRARDQVQAERDRATERLKAEIKREREQAQKESERLAKTIEQTAERLQEDGEIFLPLQVQLILAASRGKGKLEDKLSDLESLFRNDPLTFAETVISSPDVVQQSVGGPVNLRFTSEVLAKNSKDFKDARERLSKELKRVNDQIINEFKRNPEIYIGIVAAVISFVATPIVGGLFNSLGLAGVAGSTVTGATVGSVVSGGAAVGVAAAKGVQDTGDLLDIGFDAAESGAITGAVGGAVTAIKADQELFKFKKIDTTKSLTFGENIAVDTSASAAKAVAKKEDSDTVLKAALLGGTKSAIGQGVEFESQAAEKFIERGAGTIAAGLTAKADTNIIGAFATKSALAGAVEGGTQDIISIFSDDKPLEDQGIIPANTTGLSGGLNATGPNPESALNGAVFTTAGGVPLATVSGELAKESDPDFVDALLNFGGDLLGITTSQIILSLAEQPINKLFHVGQPNRVVTQAEYVNYNRRLRQLQGEIRDIKRITNPQGEIAGTGTGGGFVPQSFKLQPPKKTSDLSKFLLTSGILLVAVPEVRQKIIKFVRS